MKKQKFIEELKRLMILCEVSKVKTVKDYLKISK